MRSAICTLFEGDYHYGVSALTNSLYAKGFRGSIYAGYRGSLPFWASEAKDGTFPLWKGASTLYVANGLHLHFLPIQTSYHFTNYKPDFILELWNTVSADSEALFYFDPDIVLTAPWFYIEEWVNCGIAVCEDVKSPLERFHPRRTGWRTFYAKYDIKLNFKNAIYVNGGFIGILRTNKAFLEKWQLMQQHMGDLIGGLNRSLLTGNSLLPVEFSYDYSAFGATDQDALNATIEACDFEISYMRQDAMALSIGSQVLMPHAIGRPKPWRYQPFKSFLKGKIPRLVDKQYWKLVDSPIRSYSKSKIARMNFLIKLFSFLGRFYKAS